MGPAEFVHRPQQVERPPVRRLEYGDWLSGERDDHPTNLDDNLRCAALLFAAIGSANTGQPVEVPEFLRRHLGR